MKVWHGVAIFVVVLLTCPIWIGAMVYCSAWGLDWVTHWNWPQWK